MKRMNTKKLRNSSYPPYLQTICSVFFLKLQLLNFYDFVSLSLTCDPMGVKISKGQGLKLTMLGLHKDFTNDAGKNLARGRRKIHH